LREVEQRLRVATTNTVSSRSSYSTAGAASSRRCFAPPNGRAARRSGPSCAKTRFEAAPKEDGKLRRFKEFFDGAKSWSRVERIIARIEVGAEGPDTRFIVTNLKVRNARVLYEDVYCRRGQAENHIKSWKTHLAADRTSCTKATANQLRLFLHAGAYWLMWGLSASMPRRSMWRVAQFDTLRLRLIKVAARVAGKDAARLRLNEIR
jgi:hypothetical protein